MPRPSLSRYRYRGRHRAPSAAGRAAARLAVAGVTAAVPLGLAQAGHAAPPGGWGPIIECESSGRNVENGSGSSASGYFQFVDGTWRAFGGDEFAPRAIEATFEEQLVVAERAFDRNGLRDWEASRSCWGDQIPAAGRQPAPQAATPPERPGTGEYTVKAGDTLSGIAAAHDTTWPRLFELNRDVIENSELIFPGERLRLA